MKRSGMVSVAIALLLGSLTVSALAQESKAGFVTSPAVVTAQDAAKQRQREIIQQRLNGQNSPDNFGTQCCQILQIPAAAFHTIEGAVPTGDSDQGYLYASTYVGLYDFWAPVQLPTGAHIEFVDLYYYDTSGSDLRIDLRALMGGNNGIGGTGNPTNTTIQSVFSTGSGGYDYSAASVDYTVDNDPAYRPGGAQLILRTFFTGPTDGSEKFKAVDIWWSRQITPAPATATFNDVAPGDFGFQQIEALSRSGITGGCGGGNYCPNANLTRAQMAIFLAKALGLYWPF